MQADDFIINLDIFSQAWLHRAISEVLADLLHLVARLGQLKELEDLNDDGLRKIGYIRKHTLQLVNDLHPFVSHIDLFALLEKRL